MHVKIRATLDYMIVNDVTQEPHPRKIATWDEKNQPSLW